jgi:tight adherence protein C
VDPPDHQAEVAGMTWVVTGGYVAAGVLFLTGTLLRSDPRVARALGVLSVSEAASRASLAARVGRRARMPRARASVEARLRSSGRPVEEADAALGRKVLMCVAGIVAGLATLAAPPLQRIALAALLGTAGFQLPDFLLARGGTASRARMSGAVPDLLDVVAVSVTAGLTPRLALDRATDSVPGPLAAELRRARREVMLGTSWRQALRAMAVRTGVTEVRSLAVTLERGERLGIPVAEHLRALAREVRAERRASDEERARRAPVLMLFPLVFLILPAFVLAAVVPAVLVATRGIQ